MVAGQTQPDVHFSVTYELRIIFKFFLENF